MVNSAGFKSAKCNLFIYVIKVTKHELVSSYKTVFYFDALSLDSY